jgi:hypothetical protein
VDKNKVSKQRRLRQEIKREGIGRRGFEVTRHCSAHSTPGLHVHKWEHCTHNSSTDPDVERAVGIIRSNVSFLSCVPKKLEGHRGRLYHPAILPVLG